MSTSTVQLESSSGSQPARPTVITIRDVRHACKACSAHAAASKAADNQREVKKAAVMKVFEALLGIKTEDEVTEMSPEALRRTARRRIAAGLVELRGIDAEALLEKVIQKSKSERRPSWKDCFVEVLGEAAATKIQAATPESFYYRFSESGLT